VTDIAALTAAQAAENVVHGAARSDAVAAAVRRAVPDGRELTLLDYGCGPGHIGLRLTDYFARVILADVDPAAIDLARTAAAGRANVEVRVMDLTHQIPTGLRADVVVSCLAWHHIRDLDPLLAALPHVAPGSRLLVADMDADGGAYHADNPEFADITGFDRAALERTLARHHYHDITAGDLWQSQKWVAGRLTPLSLFLLQAVVPAIT